LKLDILRSGPTDVEYFRANQDQNAEQAENKAQPSPEFAGKLHHCPRLTGPVLLPPTKAAMPGPSSSTLHHVGEQIVLHGQSTKDIHGDRLYKAKAVCIRDVLLPEGKMFLQSAALKRSPPHKLQRHFLVVHIEGLP
jgi:hypothetical protein